MKIRPVEPRDRERIHQILLATNRFTEEEVRIADELVESAVEHPEKGDYIVHVLEEPDSGPNRLVQGYVCYGPTPMTDGVFDLYWIAVDPRQQGLGFGQLLLQLSRLRAKDWRHPLSARGEQAEKRGKNYGDAEGAGDASFL